MDKIETELKKFLNSEHDPTLRNCIEYANISQSEIERKYGSWNEALQENGVEINAYSEIKDRELLEDMQSIYDQYGNCNISTYRTHGKFSASTIEKRFGSWTKAQEKLGIMSNLDNNNYTIDKDFFHKPWNEEQAYVLGFFMADGHLKYGQTNNKKSPTAYTINFASTDKEIPQMIKQVMNSEHPIRTVEPTSVTKQNTHILELHGKKLTKPLYDMNLQGQKFDNLKFPDMRDDLQRHFIRGFFDGDGHVSIVGSISGGFSSSDQSFLSEIQNKLPVKTTLSTESLIWSGKNKTAKIHEYFYEDAEYFLSRKKKTMDRAIN